MLVIVLANCVSMHLIWGGKQPYQIRDANACFIHGQVKDYHGFQITAQLCEL
jgi:hypothetical protein